MSGLAEKQCEACRANAPRVTEDEARELQGDIPEWRMIEVNGEERLHRVFKFRNFAQALEFTNEVGGLAEAENHHPAVLLEYGKVTVDWWTHKINGLHKNDFIMAARTDLAYRDMK
jgi:4a-hydroxytetrahydrobiopterin dehydratase